MGRVQFARSVAIRNDLDQLVADLPIVQPTKFHLVINLKATKAIALTIQPMMPVLADHEIE
jgi:hypothetical protein